MDREGFMKRARHLWDARWILAEPGIVAQRPLFRVWFTDQWYEAAGFLAGGR